MKVALLLPIATYHPPNLGNTMICESFRRLLKRTGFTGKVREFSFLKSPSQEELKQINNCDLAIFVGTNIFQDAHPGWEWTAGDLEKIEIPYWLFGVGYSGPLDPPEAWAWQISRETQDLIDWTRGAKGIGVRDPRTEGWLAYFGVPSELIGCPVLAYPENFDGLSPGKEKPVLAVRKILLHGAEKEVLSAQDFLVEEFFKEYPRGVSIIQEPADLLSLEGKPRIREFEEIKAALSDALFTISTRLHAGMFSVSCGRPSIFLSHDSRVASFCDMLKLPLRRLTTEDVEKAFEAAKNIEKGDLSELDGASHLIPFYRNRLEDYLKRVFSLSEKYQCRRVKEDPQINLRTRDMEIIRLRQALSKKDNELALLKQSLIEIENSLTWRLLRKYDGFINLLLPQDSRRRLWYDQMISTVQIILNESRENLFTGVRQRLKQILYSFFPARIDETSEEDLLDGRKRLMIVVPTMEMGGAERCTAILLEHVNRTLIKPEVVTIFDRKRFYPIPRDIKVYVLEKQPSLLKPPLNLSLPDHLHRYMKDLAWMEMTALKLAMVIQKRRASVVLAQDYYASIISLLAKKHLPPSIKYIVSAHSDPTGLFSIDKKDELKSFLVRRLFNHADCILAVSDSIAQELKRTFATGSEKILYIQNPLNLAQVKNLAEEEVKEHPWFVEDIPIILYVGRLAPYKGLDYLLRAISMARKSIKLRCVIIGEGGERKKLQKLVRQMGILKDVLFLRKQQNPFKFMRRSSVFVLPSLFEGLPYVLREALACGCPVIATDCQGGGPAEILEQGKCGQ
ncbi:MAG: glycosyltransferase, partial [Nitrospirota bacterium]